MPFFKNVKNIVILAGYNNFNFMTKFEKETFVAIIKQMFHK